MIVLNPLKIKCKFHKKLKKYQNILNFGNLECPCCHSNEYILWGSYERGVIYFVNNSIHSETIIIKRIRCKSCNSTHALLPFGITPYKQVTDEVLIAILMNINHFNFSEDTIKYYHLQFKKYHYSYLSTMLHKRNFKEILKQLKMNVLEQYINTYNRCFMQIKLQSLIYCSF